MFGTTGTEEFQSLALNLMYRNPKASTTYEIFAWDQAHFKYASARQIHNIR